MSTFCMVQNKVARFLAHGVYQFIMHSTVKYSSNQRCSTTAKTYRVSSNRCQWLLITSANDTVNTVADNMVKLYNEVQ